MVVVCKGGFPMINSVSNVSFRGETAGVNAQDLINSQGKYTTVTEVPADSFQKEGAQEKKKGGYGALIGTLLVALATFAGLGYAVKKGHLEKVEVPAEGFFAKAKAHIKNGATTVGEWAGKCWDTVAGWFGKGAKEVTEKADDATKAAEKAAE